MEQIQEDHKRYTPEEYFALLEQSEEKLEYHDGEVFMMAGATSNHNIISSNMIRRILEGLDNKDCILVSQEEPLVEVFFKQDDKSWHYQASSGIESEVTLAFIKHTIMLKNIYQKVSFKKDNA